MRRSCEPLRADALRIWNAGLDAVRSDRLVAQAVALADDRLCIDDLTIELSAVRRIVVVGAGKAGAGMAAGLERVLGPKWLREKNDAGWVNVPADCVRELDAIHLHAARPAGRNEPTPEGLVGTEAILRLVHHCNRDDLCICLLSGGASALLPAPVEGISLDDKLAVTRHLSAAGANIHELNTVRKHLSRIKGGRLLAACNASTLVTLIISDVIGDRLDIIGSGPTIIDTSTPDEALAILERYGARAAGISSAVFAHLAKGRSPAPLPTRCASHHVVIGNNATAVDAAGAMAEQLGYSHAMHCATAPEASAEEVGRHLAQMALAMRATDGPDCLITGGEPVVKLAPVGVRGVGGRNQQLALAALVELQAAGAAGMALLAGATDGEDGPTDAAGALLDADVIAAASRQGLDPADYLARNDAYHFFEPLSALIKTGPTHTNVCDVRVVVVDRGIGSRPIGALARPLGGVDPHLRQPY